MKIVKLLCAIVVAGFLSAGATANISTDKKATTKMSSKELAGKCAMLDDPKRRPRMDALLNKLLVLCERTHEFGGVESKKHDSDHDVQRIPGTDAQVNDRTDDTGPSQTQSETSLAFNENTGTICSGYNDSYSFATNEGFTGFSRSTDRGVTFDDGGAVDINSFGDPSMVWRKSDGNFYLATLHSDGLGVYRSTDDCQTFALNSLGHEGGADDKELLAVDNNPASDYYGRMHLVWTNFDDARIYATYSDDAINWSTPVALSDPGTDTQGAYPIITTDGTLYVAWIRWNPFFAGPMDIEASRSVDGGETFERTANPLTGAVSPYQAFATDICGRPALNGFIRYLNSPQIAVSPNGDLHVVYTYDSDGRDVGDVVDVYYRRSTDMGATWLPEIKVNDDDTETDQFFPSLSAGPTGRIVVAWYDRRLDPGNNLFLDYYAAVSENGGASFEPNERISDESTPIALDPELALCYHGDYDQQLQTASSAFIQWADDRELNGDQNDANVYFDENEFDPDFHLVNSNAIEEVCVPSPAVYEINVNQSLGFSEPVTLSVSGVPAGMSSAFSPNPVVPTGSSTLTISNTAAGPAGTFTLDVNGTVDDTVRASQVKLVVATETPDTVVSVSPADGATEQPLSPMLTWAASNQAATYTIEVASDASFSNLIAADQVTGTSYTVPVMLSPETTYYWRVTADNACGTSVTSAVSSFVTKNIICVTSNEAIPDNAPNNGLVSSTTISSINGLTDLDVSIVAEHTYIGDLIFTLTHEDTGTSVVLIDRPGSPPGVFGCAGENIDVILDDDSDDPAEDECGGGPAPAINGTFSPNNPLAAFNGELFAGTWSLTVQDFVEADVGILNQWCLIPVAAEVFVDSDDDGISDEVDNCTNSSNPNQEDSNGDGIGNACDGDVNNDCIVNFLDIAPFGGVFNSAVGDANYNPDYDFNSSNSINFVDFTVLSGSFGLEPGPSANACVPASRSTQP